VRDTMLPLSLVLIIIGIVLAILVHWGLGVAVIVVGLLVLLFDAFDGRPARRPR
jgi:phosphatidylglycerophosphate synthase